MKNKIQFILAVTMSILMLGTAQAQEEPTFSVSGTVDTYYRSSEYSPGTAFANLNGFALGMADIVLS